MDGTSSVLYQSRNIVFLSLVDCLCKLFCQVPDQIYITMTPPHFLHASFFQLHRLVGTKEETVCWGDYKTLRIQVILGFRGTFQGKHSCFRYLHIRFGTGIQLQNSALNGNSTRQKYSEISSSELGYRVSEHPNIT